MNSEYNQWARTENSILNQKEYDNKRLLDELVKHQITLPDGDIYFRARLIEGKDKCKLNSLAEVCKGSPFCGFPPKYCGAPPASKATPGRCNVEKESVLYLAQDKYTSLAEVRPDKRDRINIAEFRLKKDVKIIDLIYKETAEVDLFSMITLYFYIFRSNDHYKLSQHITSLVKKQGFDGIRYSSSVSANGINLVLFDTEAVDCLNSKIYQTHAVLYYAEEQLPRNNNERLLPTSITDRFNEEEIDCFFKHF